MKGISNYGLDLIQNMLQFNPNKRCGINEILNDPFLRPMKDIMESGNNKKRIRCVHTILSDTNDIKSIRKSLLNEISLFNIPVHKIVNTYISIYYGNISIDLIDMIVMYIV